MYSIGIVSILFGLFFLQSEKYRNVMEDSEYIKTKTFGNLELSLEYKSTAEMLNEQLNDVEDGNSVSKGELKESLEDYMSFKLKLENLKGNGMLKNIVKTVPEYQALIQYLSFDMQKDLFLCTENDTLQCSFAHFERNFDLAPYANIGLGFYRTGLGESICQNENWSVLLHADRFGLGPLYFRFDSDKVCDN